MENNNIVNDIERIVKENTVQVIESNGRTFATKSLVEIEPRKDVAAEIRFSDLSSIVEIVKLYGFLSRNSGEDARQIAGFAQVERMSNQLRVMLEYSNILNERILTWGHN